MANPRARDFVGFAILGIDEFDKLLQELGPKVNRNLRRTALRATARQLAKKVRKRAPKVTGALRRSIGVKNGRFSSFVGLNKKLTAEGKTGRRGDGGARIRFYYKTLDLEHAGGAPLNPWFEDAIEAHKAEVGQDLLQAYKTELAKQAGKAWARSKSRNGYKGR